MERIRRYLNAIPPVVEFAIVVVLAFGLPILGTILIVSSGDSAGSISQPGLESLLIDESIILGVLALFLFLRGWTLQRIGLNPSLFDSAVGLLLVVAAVLITDLAVVIAAGFSPDLMEAANNPGFITPGFDAATVLAASVLNGLFEEVFLCGYVITALKERRGFWTAINVSVAIRLSYHLYQGPVGVLDIVPVGLVFGYFYARTGRLWPLVFGHALVDFVGLMQYSG
jgi:membrane protease YdiL (CAAX protease family)